MAVGWWWSDEFIGDFFADHFTNYSRKAMSSVNLTTGKVSWTDPTTGTDGGPLTGGDAVTGYTVGIRSTTATGSTPGVYPFTANVAATAVNVALATVLAGHMVADSYAAAVQANSADGPSAWSTEFAFTGTLPVPNAPTGVGVA